MNQTHLHLSWHCMLVDEDRGPGSLVETQWFDLSCGGSLGRVLQDATLQVWHPCAQHFLEFEDNCRKRHMDPVHAGPQWFSTWEVVMLRKNICQWFSQQQMWEYNIAHLANNTFRQSFILWAKWSMSWTWSWQKWECEWDKWWWCIRFAGEPDSEWIKLCKREASRGR